MWCKRYLAVTVVFALLACSGNDVMVGQEYEIVQSRGADPSVDYASLTRFGPWDDRNYDLTAADLEVLPPAEREIVVPIPAFFRVLMRKANPDLPDNPSAYGRNATQIFFHQYGGYLIDGMLYKNARLEGSGSDARYVVVQEGGVPYKDPSDTAAR